MDLHRVVNDLGLGQSQKILAVEWPASQRAMPHGELQFLSPGFVTEACTGTFLPPAVVEDAIDVARRTAKHSALCALAWHCHWCLFHFEGYPSRIADHWPSMEVEFQDKAGLFYLLVLLSWFPHMQRVHQAHALPESVVRANMDQIYRRGQACSEMFGRWGLDAHAARWLANYLRGEIYALGKLPYQFSIMQDPIRVYRHRKSSMVIALSEDGVHYREDGQRCRVEDTESAWTSTLVATDRTIVGHPILPTGSAVRKQVTLSASQWIAALCPGDPVLFFHIPGGSPLDHGLCAASFQAAMEFFPRYFPQRPYRAFYCASWLLDTQLENWLPATSNIVRFLREFYLFPGAISAKSILHAVFRNAAEDLSRAPRQTTLQRAILDHLSDNKPLDPWAGRCFLFPEDLAWGTQVYRTTKFPWDLVDT